MTSLRKQIKFIAIVMMTALVACTEKTEDSNRAEKVEDSNRTEKAVSIPTVTDGRIAELQREAQEGDSDAQYNLAYMYENGVGIAKDEAKALELYKKAAGQGHAAAQNSLDAMSPAK